MLDNQQVYKHIPRRIQEWSEQDVKEWFRINDIQINENIKIDGKQLLSITPTKLINQFKLSSFLTRKIYDWIQYDTEQFNQYVDEVSTICNGQNKVNNCHGQNKMNDCHGQNKMNDQEKWGKNQEQQKNKKQKQNKLNNKQLDGDIDNMEQKEKQGRQQTSKELNNSIQFNGQVNQFYNIQVKQSHQPSYKQSHQSYKQSNQSPYKQTQNEQDKQINKISQQQNDQNQLINIQFHQIQTCIVNQSQYQPNKYKLSKHLNHPTNQFQQSPQKIYQKQLISQKNTKSKLSNQIHPNKLKPFFNSKLYPQSKNNKNIQLPNNNIKHINITNSQRIYSNQLQISKIKSQINNKSQRLINQIEKNKFDFKNNHQLKDKNELKNKLFLKNLQQNSSQNKQDAQTCKHIQQSEYFQDHQNNHPLKKISSQNFLHQSPQVMNQSPSYQKLSEKLSDRSKISNVSKNSNNSYYSNQVKFTSSQLMLPVFYLLTAYFNNNFQQIKQSIKIGRSTSNNLVLNTQGVSRNHAQIIIEKDYDPQGNSFNRYYLKDIGSKFGTFVEVDPQKPKKVFENQFYSIGTTTIRIDKLKLNKSRQRFDIVISIIQNQQQQLSFQNKSILTIGNKKRQYQSKQPKNSQITKRSNKQKQRRDIQLEDNQIKNYHCRFIILNRQIYLQQVQGNILQKLLKNVKFQFTRTKYHVKFGDGDVVFKLQHIYKPIPSKSQ